MCKVQVPGARWSARSALVRERVERAGGFHPVCSHCDVRDRRRGADHISHEDLLRQGTVFVINPQYTNQHTKGFGGGDRQRVVHIGIQAMAEQGTDVVEV